ncbi:forkhead box protein H1-like [Sceloporus undulatus]|uniref:forkhead box protein H1-like n=1 Tax=Sceloporus undulatus TaxID=8520 RepID=UPI001C4C5BB1|nr:forkhead box protein H1-like [Sceloporus undulatus]
MEQCGSSAPRAQTSALAGYCSRAEKEVRKDEEREEEDEEEGGRVGEGPPDKTGKRVRRRKKKYHRHAKPPYTYLGMIALVIQASPEKKLKLSQIIKEINMCFPFFKNGYHGWKDSIRHNLSSNDCFCKVLKDPTKPKAKGNFWMVDVTRIPRDALRLQNTPISRQESRVFPTDLAPYIYNGLPFSISPSQAPLHHMAATEDRASLTGQGPQHSSPFNMDNLLSNFQGVGLCGNEPPNASAAGLNPWRPVPIFRASSSSSVVPWRAPCPLPTLPSFSLHGSFSSLSTLSSNKGPEGRQRPKTRRTSHVLAKRPRVFPDCQSSSSDSDSSDDYTPPPPALHWDAQLPTSYTKFVAPNVVAPPSHSVSFLAFPGGSGPSFYNPTAAFASPVVWELMPRSSLSPVLTSGFLVDMDQTMPPNKSVFDVWMTHPSDTVSPVSSSLGSLPRSGVLNHYDPSG